MDDYHEFRHAHEIQVKECGYTNFPIMLLSLKELWFQVVQWQFLALVWEVEVEVPMVVEPLEVVELPWVVV
jgi:hypothetical protein